MPPRARCSISDTSFARRTKTNEEGMDGVASVDAQNASTSRLENPHSTRVSHTAHAHYFLRGEEENQRGHQVALISHYAQRSAIPSPADSEKMCQRDCRIT